MKEHLLQIYYLSISYLAIVSRIHHIEILQFILDPKLKQKTLIGYDYQLRIKPEPVSKIFSKHSLHSFESRKVF